MAETLGVHLRNEVIEEIEKRAAGIDKKKGTYAALILEKWFADGCPPVTEADHLVQISRMPKPPKRLTSANLVDPWNLDPEAIYILVEDDIVQRLMNKLGVPKLFDAAPKHGAFQTFVTFDNHPTHWITLSLFKGTDNKRNDGLLFEAVPKGTTPRYEIEKKVRERAAEIGAEIRGPVKLSQLPRKADEN